MKKIFFAFVVILIFYSCDFKKSAHKDLITGLSTSGNGLSCEEGSIVVNDKVEQRNTFTFGEVVAFRFSNIEGFNEQNGSVFPGMSISIRDDKNNYVLQNEDIYASYTDGIKLSPLVLNAERTLARPIHSNNKYTVVIRIWDKKGDGNFSAGMNFEVKPNEQISVSKNNCNYSEIYLFSEKSN